MTCAGKSDAADRVLFPRVLKVIKGKKEEHIDRLHICIDIYLVKCYWLNSKYTTEAGTKLAVPCMLFLLALIMKAWKRQYIRLLNTFFKLSFAS